MSLVSMEHANEISCALPALKLHASQMDVWEGTGDLLSAIIFWIGKLAVLVMVELFCMGLESYTS